MNLNIKSREAHELAVKLARLTGESMTKAVTEALRERLARECRRRDRAALAREPMEIGKRCAAHPRRGKRTHGKFLYDRRGLPA